MHSYRKLNKDFAFHHDAHEPPGDASALTQQVKDQGRTHSLLSKDTYAPQISTTRLVSRCLIKLLCTGQHNDLTLPVTLRRVNARIALAPGSSRIERIEDVSTGDASNCFEATIVSTNSGPESGLEQCVQQ